MSLLACLVAACGGGGSGGNAGAGGGPGGSLPEQSNNDCHTIPANGFSCGPNCTGIVTNASAAFDGNFGTYASLVGGGQATLSGTTEQQVAGSVAGVSFFMPDPQGVDVGITTLLNGAVQETMAKPATKYAVGDDCSGISMVCVWRSGDSSFVGLGTTKPYDEIQATLSSSESGTIKVYELCVR